MLDISTSVRGDATIVHVSGRINSVTAEGLSNELAAELAKGCASMVVDMAGVEYLSSAGMRILLVTAKDMEDSGGRFIVAALSDHLSEIIRSSNLAKLVQLVPRVEDAIP